MNVSKINQFNSTPFRAEQNKKNNEFENPISRKTERNLAILGNVVGGVAVGAVVGGLTSSIPKLKGKPAILTGVAGFLATLAITLPSKLYNTKVNAFVKEKEMDVFSRDRDLKANLTAEVGKEVQDENVSLDKKLDDNLKLQMANKGTALGIANLTSQT